MSDLTRATIRAAELLRSMAGTTGNPLNALMAFFEPILLDLKGRRFDPAEFATHVRDAYGWNFNAEVAEGFRESFARLGWITARKTASGAILFDDQGFFHVVTPPERHQMDVDRQTIDQRVDRITARFRSFLNEIGVSAQDYPHDDTHISEAILNWLLDVGAEDTDDDSRPTGDTGSRQEFDDLSDQDRFLIARFVHTIQATDPVMSADLQWIASVGLLAELAQDFQKPRTHVKRAHVTVFLDSPVALDLLGTSGKHAAALARSIVSRLQKIGATVTLFEQSIRELKNTLLAILNAAPFERYGPTQEAIMAGETDEAFLQAVVADPKAAFRAHKIHLRPVGSDRRITSSSSFTDIQLSKLYNELLSLQDSRADRDRRCQHDANAAAFVMRLRQDNPHSDLFEAGYLFLTRNRAFTNVTREFCVREEMIDESCIGPFVNMHDVASALWLRTGMYNDDEIPRRQLLAGCERVLTRNQAVVGEARRAILSLRRSGEVDEEKQKRLEAILSQDRSMLLIADRVRGRGRHLKKQDIDEIVAEFIESEKRASYNEGRSEVFDENQQLREGLNTLRAAKTDLEAQIAEIREGSRQEKERVLQSLAALQDQIRRREHEDNQRVGILLGDVNRSIARRRRLARIILVLVSLVVVAGAIWKEVVDLFENEVRSSVARDLLDNYLLLVLAILPLLVAFSDSVFRLIGLDRPAERALLETWAKSRFRKWASERGLADKPVIQNAKLLYSDGELSIAGRDFRSLANTEIESSADFSDGLNS